MPYLRSRQEQTKQAELAAGLGCGLRSSSVSDLQTLLTGLVKRYGTKTALALALGMTLERLVKVMKDPTESLGVANCLRLSKVSGLPPGQVLTMAGKTEIADLLDMLYGRTPDRGASRDELVTQWWPHLSPKAKDAMRTLLDELTLPNKPKRKPRRTRS
jgi:hypothetical protein